MRYRVEQIKEIKCFVIIYNIIKRTKISLMIAKMGEANVFIIETER